MRVGWAIVGGVAGLVLGDVGYAIINYVVVRSLGPFVIVVPGQFVGLITCGLGVSLALHLTRRKR